MTSRRHTLRRIMGVPSLTRFVWETAFGITFEFQKSMFLICYARFASLTGFPEAHITFKCSGRLLLKRRCSDSLLTQLRYLQINRMSLGWHTSVLRSVVSVTIFASAARPTVTRGLNFDSQMAHHPAQHRRTIVY